MNDMALYSISGIELFSGTGMLGEGFRAGIGYMGIPYRTICHVEREAYASAVLVARMEEGSLDAAPIWPDVTTFDASAWRGKVDCIIAGFPCQDLSIAGRRAGLDGKRSGLFFEVVRIATDSGAWLMLLENVAGIATATASVVDTEEGELDERASSRVVGELADIGWDAEWITISAYDVGANHVRARWFCLAWRVADSEHSASIERPATAMQRGRTRKTEQTRLGGSGVREIEMDNSISNRRGARRVPDGEHERYIADAASEIAVGYPRLQHRYIQQRTVWPEHPRASISVAHSKRYRGRTSWENEQRRRSDSSSGCCEQLADPGLQRLQRRELGKACNSNWWGQEAHGSVSQLCGLFAPCQSDQRWAGIIREHPELAPALEPTFRGVVNGLAFDMGYS